LEKVEDLNIKKMLSKGHKCRNKNISDVAWNNFLSLIAYKAECAGRQFVAVNPAYTSQMCNKCRHIQKIGLNDRIYKCPCCNVEIDRDLNASLNILALGLQGLGVKSLEAQGL